MRRDGRECAETDVMRLKERIVEKSEEIWEEDVKMCWPEKDEVLYDLHEKKLPPMNKGISHNVFKQVLSFDARCTEGTAVKVVDGSIV